MVYTTIKPLPEEGVMKVQVFERNKALQEKLFSMGYNFLHGRTIGMVSNSEKIIGWSKQFKSIYFINSLAESIHDEVIFEDHFRERKEVQVEIKMSFGDSNAISIIPKEVPYSLIIERLGQLKLELCRQMVAEAKLDVPFEDLEAYLQGTIETDRQKFNLLLQ